MKKYTGKIIFFAFAIVFITVLVLQATQGQNNNAGTVRISLVVYGPAERWRMLEQGVAQACSELGIDRPVITPGGNTAKEQVSSIKREMSSGADAIILAPADSVQMESYTNELITKIPLITVENTAGNRATWITADNSKMGGDFAEELAKEYKNIAVIKSTVPKESVTQRTNAFVGRAEQDGAKVFVHEIESSEFAVTETISYLHRENVEAVVAMDNESLKLISENISAASSFKLFGFGSSEELINRLDTGIVDGICFQNEYSLGYLAMMKLAEKLGLNTQPAAFSENEIDYAIIRHENMFDKKYEGLLFPIIE